jgi:hypothetical protein
MTLKGPEGPLACRLLCWQQRYTFLLRCQVVNVAFQRLAQSAGMGHQQTKDDH